MPYIPYGTSVPRYTAARSRVRVLAYCSVAYGSRYITYSTVQTTSTVLVCPGPGGCCCAGPLVVRQHPAISGEVARVLPGTLSGSRCGKEAAAGLPHLARSPTAYCTRSLYFASLVCSTSTVRYSTVLCACMTPWRKVASHGAIHYQHQRARPQIFLGLAFEKKVATEKRGTTQGVK